MERCIKYGILLKGDTDTIASMAGAIVGALTGDFQNIRSYLNHCEGYQEMTDLVDSFYSVWESSSNFSVKN